MPLAFKDAGAIAGQEGNERTTNTKAEANELKNWVSGTVPWKIFVNISITFA